MNRDIRCFALLISLMFASIGRLTAQDPDGIQQGIKAYGTYRGGDIDTVSMTNGNVIVHIPIASYPQRGKLNLSYSLLYNNKGFFTITKCGFNGCFHNLPS